jgi:hypothetical protein
MTAAPDMCVAMNISAGLMLRVDAQTAEVRVIDQAWSLPADVDGEISIAVGDWKQVYPVGHNSSIMVAAIMESSDLTEMMGAMDKATTMTVTVGKSKPKAVSLAGSTKATNAFRTCANLKGNAASGGANPFQ